MSMLLDAARKELGSRVIGPSGMEGTVYPQTQPMDNSQPLSLISLVHKEVAARRSSGGYNSLGTSIINELTARKQGYSSEDVAPDAPDMADDPFFTIDGEFADHSYDYAPQVHSEGNVFYKDTYEMEVAPWSGRPHFPATEEFFDNTGVTLGPGYDMGGRKPNEVVEDLMSVGVDESVARRMSMAAGMRGEKASQFVAEFPDEDILTEHQQQKLFTKLSTRYEDEVKVANNLTDAEWAELNPNKKKVLFDFAWHAGPRAWPKFRKALLTDDVETAYKEYGGRLPTRDEFVKDSLDVIYG